MKVGQVATIINGHRKRRRGWQIGARKWVRRRGPGTGLQPYIEKPSSRQDPFEGGIGWTNKSIHRQHHSTARRAKYAAHAKFAEQGAQRLRASIMVLRHWGVLQKVHIEECKVLQA